MSSEKKEVTVEVAEEKTEETKDVKSGTKRVAEVSTKFFFLAFLNFSLFSGFSLGLSFY